MSIGDRDLLNHLGVRIRYVADMNEGAVYLPDQRMLLLDLDMDERRVNVAMDEILPILFC